MPAFETLHPASTLRQWEEQLAIAFEIISSLLRLQDKFGLSNKNRNLYMGEEQTRLTCKLDGWPVSAIICYGNLTTFWSSPPCVYVGKILVEYSPWSPKQSNWWWKVPSSIRQIMATLRGFQRKRYSEIVCHCLVCIGTLDFLRAATVLSLGWAMVLLCEEVSHPNTNHRCLGPVALLRPSKSYSEYKFSWAHTLWRFPQQLLLWPNTQKMAF